MRLICYLTLLLLPICLTAQNSCKISGHVRDASSFEALIGAYVIDTINNKGVTTNEFGYFSINLPENAKSLKVTYVGYKPFIFEIKEITDTVIDVKLEIENNLDEIIISSGYDRVNSTYAGVETLSAKTLEGMPVVLGEPDITKTITLLPGVTFGTESTAGYIVRGGSPDQNLILIDGAPIYNPYHMHGFFSVFNSDAINSARIYKGSIPSKYGGRLSSVLDIQMKEGNAQKLSGKIKIGLESSKILIEGPIVKERTSFLLTARRSMIDTYPGFLQNNIALLTGMAEASGRMNLDNYWFYDMNGKINHRFSSRDKLFINFYMSEDNYSGGFERDLLRETLSWGNGVSSVRWNHVFGNNLFGNLTIYHSKYKYRSQKGLYTNLDYDNLFKGLTYSSDISDYSLKLDFNYSLGNHKLKFGGQYLIQELNPDVISNSLNDTPQNTIPEKEIKYITHQGSIYIEDEFNISTKTTLNAGARLSIYNADKTYYPSFEPRASVNYKPQENLAIKLSYAHMVQHLHLLSDNWSGLPSDIWVPSTREVRPERGNQVSLGFDYDFIGTGINFSADAFAKNMTGVVDYEEGMSHAQNTNWENSLVVGKGKAYGYEVGLRKNQGSFSGLISYTWAKSLRQFDELNRGNEFPYVYDRNHNFNIALMYRFNEKYSMGANWVFASGHPVTIAEQYVTNYLQYNEDIKYFSSLNNFRLPNYHRLDWSLNYMKSHKKVDFGWTLGVYNMYNRQNTYYINDGVEGLANITLLGILPYFNLKMRF